jgi:prepilin-type N-terminal cleavage/methylation domain-containing protein
MRNRKGFTLVEILAGITILAIAVLAFAYLMQQTTWFSKQNDTQETNIQTARTVMEEIKTNLKTGKDVTSLKTPIAIASIKDQSPPVTLKSEQQSIKIDIQSLPISDNLLRDPPKIKGFSIKVEDYFRNVKVTCTNIQTGKSYTLQAYVEYK